ncbi:hypothetical protein PRIPAC_97179 [Pristionchus pacificus]|uniref:Uncharacterized protein n=1 Tax=Pristionchus pacificus TaxID=54126 RepID=A0A2A6CUY8_PRIPA|nr:hypothetical protein PRIPAC_97179 [Pristionchus pacificus]|eukprot:PDM81841.1 hypothetical protein PRIPAC_33995 [Pristionchus pacificus]
MLKEGIYRLVGEQVPERLTRRKEIEILQSLSEYLRMILRSENERAQTLMELLGEERYAERKHEPIHEAGEYNLECDQIKVS